MLFLVGLFAAHLLFCWNAAKGYISPSRIQVVRPSGIDEVSVPTRFGDTPSWVSPGFATHPSETVFVLAHGYGGARDTWSNDMRDLAKAGYDSVAPSMPGQDASPAKRVGFAIDEGHTLVDVVKWARQRGAKHVVVMGVSMGGSAAWMASEEDPTIDAVISDGAYARFDEAMNSFFNRKVPGGSVILAPVVWFAKMMTGLDPGSVRPVEAAAKWHGRPALIIHGESDSLFPRDNAERLAAAAGCPTWIVPGAEHAGSYEAAPAEYIRRVTDVAKRLK